MRRFARLLATRRWRRLAVAVLLCATLWLLLHMAGVMVRGSLRLERGPRPAMGLGLGGGVARKGCA